MITRNVTTLNCFYKDKCVPVEMTSGVVHKSKPSYIRWRNGKGRVCVSFFNVFGKVMVEKHFLDGKSTDTQLIKRGEVFSDAYYLEGCNKVNDFMWEDLAEYLDEPVYLICGQALKCNVRVVCS